MFWGGEGKSVKMFWVPENVIRLDIGVYKRETFRPIFRKFQILTLVSLYILQVQKNLQYMVITQQISLIYTHTRYCNTVLYQGSVTNTGIK